MSYTSLPSPMEIFEQEILPNHSEPLDQFERALWCSELVYVFKELLLEFEERYSREVGVIFREDLHSDVYTLETPVTLVRVVDVPKLRSEMPEVFSDIVYLRCSDAEKVLGRRYLYNLCKSGYPERIKALEWVNLGDLERVLASCEVGSYVRVVEKPGVPVVCRVCDSVEEEGDGV